MKDLGLKQDANSAVCFEETCNRMDKETALRYNTHCEFLKLQGIDCESTESLADFLCTEAVALDRLGISTTGKSSKAEFSIVQQESNEYQSPTSKCSLGCVLLHRLVVCAEFMQK